MIIRDALTKGSDLLKKNGNETPFLDASVLLSYLLGISKEKLYASYPDNISDLEYNNFIKLLDKRINGTPVSYIINKKEFYGLEFYVDERVLVPRADTEILVEKALEIIMNNSNLKKVHDLCSGSGCISISLKKNSPETEVSASDISDDAIEVFKKNCKSNSVDIPIFKNYLLDNIESKFDMICTNPPYLGDSEVDEMAKINWPEPELALRAGTEGLDLINLLVPQTYKCLNNGGYLLMEAASVQFDAIKGILEYSCFKNISILDDLAGRKRVIIGQKL